jgi:hypothetical protein
MRSAIEDQSRLLNKSLNDNKTVLVSVSDMQVQQRNKYKGRFKAVEHT